MSRFCNFSPCPTNIAMMINDPNRNKHGHCIQTGDNNSLYNNYYSPVINNAPLIMWYHNGTGCYNNTAYKDERFRYNMLPDGRIQSVVDNTLYLQANGLNENDRIKWSNNDNASIWQIKDNKIKLVNTNLCLGRSNNGSLNNSIHNGAGVHLKPCYSNDATQISFV
jgi:hypothetical protein